MKSENWNVKSYGFIQQGFAKSGAEVFHSTFVLLMNISAKLKLRASNPPPSASPKPLCGILNKSISEYDTTNDKKNKNNIQKN